MKSSSSSSSSCLLSIFLLSSATAIFWPSLGPNFWNNAQPTFTKICLYSNDPRQFTPMCIMCPNTLYPIVLTTCVTGVAIPNNVTYTQANCIVGNCAVNLNPGKKGRREVEELQATRLMSDMYGGAQDLLSVPYTVVVDGRNVTVTSVEEYYVHSDAPNGEEYEEELLEI